MYGILQVYYKYNACKKHRSVVSVHVHAGSAQKRYLAYFCNFLLTRLSLVSDSISNIKSRKEGGKGK